MKKIILGLIIIVLSLFAFAAGDAPKVAIVKIKKGNATALGPDGTQTELKRGEWIKEGSIVKTGAKSFVKIAFIDKSSMNIGPESELKIEKFSKKEAGVINVLSGKIRSQVTKDYLNMDKDKSKLFIKSKSAVMGIRGTDFMFSTSKATGATTAVLFEGSVVFSKIQKNDNLRDLEKIVNKGRKIVPGQFSVAYKNKNRATVPSKMSSKQFYKLEKNKDFEVSDASQRKKSNSSKSVVPPGLTGAAVSSDNENLKQEIKKVINIDVTNNDKDSQQSDSAKKEEFVESKGFRDGEDVKPADGSLVHLESGTVIPMGVDSEFDTNAGEWKSSTVGSVDEYGEYVPPEKHEITSEGDILRQDPTTGEVVKIDNEIGVPIDEQAAFNDLKGEVVSKEVEAGPEPAGEEVKDGSATREPDSETKVEGDILPPPPQPGDCSTCTQPPSLFNGNVVKPPVESGKTRVNVQVN